MCFCSMENDTMSSVLGFFFPIIHFIIIFFLIFTKKKVWFSLNTRAILMWKNLYLDKKLRIASDHSSSQILWNLRKQKYQCSCCTCSSQRVKSDVFASHNGTPVTHIQTCTCGWAHSTLSRSWLHTPIKFWNSSPVSWTLPVQGMIIIMTEWYIDLIKNKHSIYFNIFIIYA